MAQNKNDIRWLRPDVFANLVSLPVFVWEHIDKHTFDKVPATEEHVLQTLTDPDQAHRNDDPVTVGESCVFVKYFEAEEQRFIVPVLYEGVIIPNDYEMGNRKGRILTGYFPKNQNISQKYGEIFWSKPGPIDPKKKDK